MSEPLLEQHLQVLFELDATNRITRVNEPDPEEAAPLVFIARGCNANLVRFRNDVPDVLTEEIEYVVQKLSPWRHGQPDPDAFDDIRAILARWRPISREEQSLAFKFPYRDFELSAIGCTLITTENDELLTESFAYTKSILAQRSPVVAVVRNGQAVSACFSARTSLHAAEAGVATIKEYRGSGFALATVAAWARAVIESGLTPLYSTSRDNQASLAVAARLALQPYATTLAMI